MARRKKPTSRARLAKASPLAERFGEVEAQAAIRAGTARLHAQDALPVIKVVGMSGAGKSTLVGRLRSAGYDARAVSQEHSAIPDLWRRFDPPWVLIFLTLDLDTQKRRRADVTWTPDYFRTEEARLASARSHADLRIDTSQLAAAEVYTIVESYLQRAQIRHAAAPLQPLPSTGSASRRASDPRPPAATGPEGAASDSQA